jgi:AAA-like domain/TIR domain
MRRTPPSKIFISYARRDSGSVELAQVLRSGLTDAGAEVFIDTSMEIGTAWGSEIGFRLSWCDHFIVLLSESACGSEMVKAEVRLVFQRYKSEGIPQILPIRVAYMGELTYELAAYIGGFQYEVWSPGEDSAAILNNVLAVTRGRRDWGERAFDGLPPGPRFTVKTPARPEPSVDLRYFVAPGGAQPISDPFYLERQADRIAKARAQLPCDTLVIKALRQMGKSSLLARYLAACKNHGKRVGLVDLSILTDADMADYDRFLAELASLLLLALRIEGRELPKSLRQAEFNRLMEEAVLPEIPNGGVIAFDEVDRVLGKPYQGDFFSMLRAWHNSRAIFESQWERLSLALVISTEPYLLINSADRSPFNVTPPVILEGFELEQCRSLNRLYGDLISEAGVHSLLDLLDGHPYLTRLAFYQLVSQEHDLEWVLNHATDRGGPFADHLNSRLFQLSQQPRLLESMLKVIKDGEVIEEDHFHRLKGAGLIRGEGKWIRPSNRLYAEFFGKAL